MKGISEDPYEILGVSQESPSCEIDESYKRLIAALEPYIRDEPLTARRYQEIQKAYELITHPVDNQSYIKECSISREERCSRTVYEKPLDYLLRFKVLFSVLTSSFFVMLLCYCTVFWMNWVTTENILKIEIYSFWVTIIGWGIFLSLRLLLRDKNFNNLLFLSIFLSGFIYTVFVFIVVRKHYVRDEWYRMGGTERLYLTLGGASLLYILANSAIFLEPGNFIHNSKMFFSKKTENEILRDLDLRDIKRKL